MKKNRFSIKSLLILAVMAAGAIGVSSCGDSKDDPYKWREEWNKGKDNPGGGNEDDPTTPTEKETPKPRFVWIDASGNFNDYANSEENIREACRKIAQTGFSDIVVDVRPTTGDILYSSTTGTALKRMDLWEGSSYLWKERTATFDYLKAFIDYGHEAGLKVHASFNTFVGGYLCPYGLGSEGMLFSDSSKKDWGTIVNTASGLVNTMDLLDDSVYYGAKFLNPSKSEVQDYVLTLLKDLAKYDLDGIILDRCRYSDDGLMADFSDESRAAFESFIGKSVANYPSDIMQPGTESLYSFTTIQKQWLAFRAKTIHDFIVKAEKAVHGVNSSVKFGAYVGAWYSDYYPSGVNWASPDYDPSKVYSWASSDYKDYGFADHLDELFIGAYASANAISGSSEWTVEGFCKLAGAKIKDAVPYYGGPDIGNADGWTGGGQATALKNAFNTCLDNSDGFFIFDLCHIKMYNYWSALESMFTEYLADFE